MPVNAHMDVTGNKQGKIDGSCDISGRENTMLVYAMDHDIHIPRDPQTGLPSGKRIHGPLKIVKEFDKASPKLYQALCSGEQCSEVSIKWYRINETGTEEHYFTHTLVNAIIVEMKPYMPMAFVAENEPYRHMEEVSFTYSKIRWNWEIDGVEAEDEWKAPK